MEKLPVSPRCGGGSVPRRSAAPAASACLVALALVCPSAAVRGQDSKGGAAGKGHGTVLVDNRLERDVTSALVFIEKSGVNSIVLDSAPDLKGIFRNLSVSLTMYSGQMRTAPQNVYIPAAGIEVDGEQVPFGDIARGLVGAIESLLSDDQRAGDVLGAIKGSDVADLIADAAASGQVLLESRRVNHPTFPAAEVRTPLIVKVDADYQRAYMRPMSGPVIYLIATADTEESLDLASMPLAIKRAAILIYRLGSEGQP